MLKTENTIVDIKYQQTGTATAVNPLEKSIGRSFKNTNLTNSGFFANWEVASYFNLTDVKNEQDKKGRFIEFFRQNSAKILVCAHATLRNGMKELEDEAFNDTLLAIDEFHHTSADANSNLGDVVRRVMNNSTGHIVAMTGSYFRGDGVPVLRAEDEARFFPVTYKKIAEIKEWIAQNGRELKQGLRSLVKITKTATLSEGRFYFVSGQMLLLEKIGELKK